MNKSQLKQLIKEVLNELGGPIPKSISSKFKNPYNDPYYGSRPETDKDHERFDPNQAYDSRHPERKRAQKFAPVGGMVKITQVKPTGNEARDKVISALIGLKGKVTGFGESDWLRHVNVNVPNLGPAPVKIYVSIYELGYK